MLSPAMQWTDSSGCPGGNQVSRKQGHGLRDVPDDHVERKNEITRVALLPNLAIDAGFDCHSRPWIEIVGHHRSNRTEGVKAFRSRPLTICIADRAR